jgi:hypothetical protein
MPAKKKTQKTSAPRAAPTRPVAKKSAAKKPAGARTAKGRTANKAVHAKRIKERLHTPISRRPQAVSETELEAVTVAVLAVVAEVATETAVVFAELLARIERIEAELTR